MAGEIDREVDPEQLGWELNSLLVAANGHHAVDGEPIAFERARRAIRNRLDRSDTASHN
jgi:hypothetical protein